MRLRAATPADLPLLERWDRAPHVLSADPHDDWNWKEELSRNPPSREWLIAELPTSPSRSREGARGSAGRAVGFVEILNPSLDEDRYWGEMPPDVRAIDIWIGEGSDLGKGYGTQIMQAALARCFKSIRVNAVLVDPLASNARAIRFYEKLGFKFVEDRRFGQDDCKVYRMDRAAYLAYVTSLVSAKR